MKNSFSFAATALAALLAPITFTVEAQETERQAVQHELVTELVTNPIEYRALIKRAMEGHLGALGLILTRRAPDMDQAPFHADALVQLTARHASLYPESSASPQTRDTVWTDRQRFETASNDTAEIAEQLRATVEQGSLIQKVNGVVSLGESCESCHARFRSDIDR